MNDHVRLQLKVICKLRVAVLTHVRVVHHNVQLLRLAFRCIRIYTDLDMKPATNYTVTTDFNNDLTEKYLRSAITRAAAGV